MKPQLEHGMNDVHVFPRDIKAVRQSGHVTLHFSVLNVNECQLVCQSYVRLHPEPSVRGAVVQQPDGNDNQSSFS